MTWSVTNLASLAPSGPQYGANARAIPADGERPRYVRITDIDTNGCLIPTSIVEADIEESSDFLLKEGDLLFARSGNTVGKTYRYSAKDGPCIFAGYLIRFRIDPKLSDSRFVFYYTLSSNYNAWVMSKRRVAGQPNINGKEYSSLQVPFFPLSEQQRIIEILDQACALRKKRSEANDKTARILPALFYKMFGDPAINPMDWPVKPMEDIAFVRGGKRLPKGEEYSPIPTPYRYIRGVDITPNVIRSEFLQYLYPEIQKKIARYTVSEGDVVITIAGKIGVCAPVTAKLEGANLTENAAKLVPKDKNAFDAHFLSALLNLPFAQQQIASHAGRVTIGKLALFRIEKLHVILPPIEQQRRFSAAVALLAQSTEQQCMADDRIEHLFETLLHRAFTGDLTAKWREAHMKELLAEMETQAKILDCPLKQSKPLEVESKRHAGHDMYNKAALASYITERCHVPNRPLGRVKLAKFFFLVQKKAEIELTQTFMKRAAGPLDDEIHKFLSLAQKNKWLVLCHGEGDLKPVKPGANISMALEQAQKLLGPAKAKVDDMLDQMKGWGYRALERWATVLDASFELKDAGQPATVETIKDVILNHPEWVPKLNRDEFSDTNIEAALKGLRGFGFITNHD